MDMSVARRETRRIPVRRRLSGWLRVGRRAESVLFLVVLCVAVGAVTASDASAFSWGAPLSVDSGTLIDGDPAGITGMSCPSASLCVAVDNAGNVLASTSPTTGEPWSLTAADPGNVFSAVSCPSVSLCVAVDDEDVVTSDSPAAGAGAWQRTEVDPSADISGVSCASAAACVAVDSDGNSLTSQDADGGAGAWTVAPADGNLASPYECYHYGGNECGPAGLDAVACPTVSLCAAVDDDGYPLSTDDPADGQLWETGPRLADPGDATKISCPTVSFCALVDGQSSTVTTWHPDGRAPAGTGPSWFTRSVVLHASALDGITCKAAGTCLAWDANHVYSSVPSAGGRLMWATDLAAPDVTAATYVTPSLVLVGTGSGQLYVGRGVAPSRVLTALSDLVSERPLRSAARIFHAGRFTLRFSPPAPGELTIKLSADLEGHRRILATVNKHATGTHPMRVVLRTDRYARTLNHAEQHIRLTADLSFAASGQPTERLASSFSTQ
jgi:hypothetical protein